MERLIEDQIEASCKKIEELLKENTELRLAKNNMAKIIVKEKIKYHECNCMYTNIHGKHFVEVKEDESYARF